MSGQIQVCRVDGWRGCTRFIDYAFQRYRGDGCWVPPLRSALKKVISGKTAFSQHAEIVLFLARREGSSRACGRVAAIHNPRHNEQHGDKIGFFGFFECDLNDAATARALIGAAEKWLAQKGLTRLRGPVSPSMNAECGLLVDGFDRPPVALMPYNPPDYPALLEAAGLARCKDLYAYFVEEAHVQEGTDERARLLRAAELLNRRYPQVKIRPIDMRNFEQEVLRLTEIFEQARRNNWGYVPVTKAEVLEMARDLRRIINPQLVLVAEVDGQPAGASMAIPDINVGLAAARGRMLPLGMFRFLSAMKRVELIRIFGIATLEQYRHMGITAMMMLQTILNGLAEGYNQAEASWVLEDNDMSNRTIQNLVAPRLYKTYRIYEKPISPIPM